MPDLLGPLRMLGDAPLRPPETLEELGTRVSRRSRRRRLMFAAAGVVLVSGASAVFATVDREDDDLRLVDDPPPTTLGAPLAGVPSGSLVSGEHGIERMRSDGGLESVSDEPTAAAFSLDAELVVAQAAEVGDVYPPTPTGPIVIYEGGERREVAPIDGAELQLLDAGFIDGRPVALATGRQGVGPDDTEERLFLFDVESGVRSDLGVVGGWESGLQEAHLSGSQIITISTAEVRATLVTRDLTGGVLWEVPDIAVDENASAAVFEGQVHVLKARFIGEAFTPTLDVARFDRGSGIPDGTASTALELDQGLSVETGFCFRAEVLDESIVCDQSTGRPFIVERDGSAHIIEGIDHGVVTLPRGSAVDTPVTCQGHPADTGDIDGDGRDDRVAYVWIGSTSVLEVCTATGTEARLDDGGQPEALRLVDLDGDGRDEILFGGTTVSAVYLRIAVLQDVQLQVVVGDDGEPVQLTDGDLERGADGVPVAVGAFGCEDRNDDGRRDVVLVTARSEGGRVSWTAEAFDLDGSLAHPLEPDSGVDELTGLLGDFAYSLTTPCE